MIKTIARYFIALAITLASFMTIAGASPVTQLGAACKDPTQRILLFPAWYKGLNCNSKGTPEPTALNDLWVIALNIIEWLVIAAAYLSVGFIVWGGFKYIKSRGDPGKLSEAKMAITQAIFGFGLTLAAVAIIEFVTGVIKTS